MAEKKEKAEKPKIEIQTRKPEKRGIFANLGNDRTKNEHPLREILNFPSGANSQNADHESLLPARSEQSNIEANRKSSESGLLNLETLDIQKNDLDIQINNTGNPKEENLDSLIAKKTKRISKNKESLDIQISKKESLDIQTEQKKTNWQRYDRKRKSKGVFLRTDDAITKKFKQFCIAQDWDFSQGTELAWNKLMNDLDSQTSGDLDSLIALDDRRLMMIFKTNSFIINLHLRYNTIFNELAAPNEKKRLARWTSRDDEAALRYNDVSPAIIELGILQTQIQKGFRTSRINSFKYYIDEIENVLSSGVSDEVLKTILDYHRQIWKNQTGREIDLSFLEKDI